MQFSEPPLLKSPYVIYKCSLVFCGRWNHLGQLRYFPFHFGQLFLLLSFFILKCGTKKNLNCPYQIFITSTALVLHTSRNCQKLLSWNPISFRCIGMNLQKVGKIALLWRYRYMYSVHDTSWKHDNMRKQRPDVTKNMYIQPKLWYLTDNIKITLCKVYCVQYTKQSQYVESDLNKKSCSGLKTTTASKGIQ